MDADRFDTLARALHTTPTRRLTLGALTALGLATLLGDAETEAGKRRGGRKKGKGRRRKRAKCDGQGCKKPDNPPEGYKECFAFNLPSGCRNVAGKPCCYNYDCHVCSPDCGCAADQQCCNEGGVYGCKKGDCCSDNDCTPPKTCSKGSESNMCL